MKTLKLEAEVISAIKEKELYIVSIRYCGYISDLYMTKEEALKNNLLPQIRRQIFNSVIERNESEYEDDYFLEYEDDGRLLIEGRYTLKQLQIALQALEQAEKESSST